MAKPSNELLTGILGVLGEISRKIDIISQKPEKDGSGMGSIIAGGYIGSRLGRKSSKGKIGDLADSVGKLNKELDKVNLLKLKSLIRAISSYENIPKESALAKRTSNMAASAKDAAMALVYMGAAVISFVAAFGIAKNVLGISPWAVLGFIVATAGALAISMLIISGTEHISEKMAGGIMGAKGLSDLKPGQSRNRGAIESAKHMGIALMYIAGGMLAFSIAVALIPRILGISPGNEKQRGNLAGAAIGAATIAITILGMGGIFFLLGFLGPKVQAGVAVAGMMTLGMIALAAGVFVFAKVAQMITGMGDTKATKELEGKTVARGKFGQMMAGIGPGLGMMGIILVSTGLLFAALGATPVNFLIGAGSLVAIAMAGALILTAKSIKSVNEVINEMGGEDGMKKTKENIKLMVSGVLTGVTEGVMGSNVIDTDSDNTLSFKEMIRFRRIMRSIRILGRISSSLSKFAMGLKAFSTLGSVMSLDYEEKEVTKNGITTTELKPKFGEKIHVIEIAKTISDTFGMFLRSLVENTEGLTRRETRTIRKLGRALTGNRGIISGVNQFANALQTFSKFGKEGKIATVETAEDGKQTIGSATIIEITNNIVNSFGEFVRQIASRASDFEEVGSLGRKMKRFNVALMGQKGIFGREKPGILSAITSFSDVLITYSEYGKGGLIPKKDENGKIISTISVADIARNMVSGISTFITSLDTALTGNTLEKNAKNVEKKIEKFSDVIGQFDKLAKSQEGMEKLANSLGLLATNMGLLVTNTGSLNTEKLNSLATITAQHAVTTKGTTIEPPESKYTASAAISKTSPESKTVASTASQPNWDQIADKIGQKIAEKLSGLNTGEFQFRFMDSDVGNLTIKR